MKGNLVRLIGVRSAENRFFIDSIGGFASVRPLFFEDYQGQQRLVAAVAGNITNGYTGAVTTSSYTEVESNETKDIQITGTGFSSNTVVDVVGNATKISQTYVNENLIIVRLLTNGSDGDFLTFIFNNGDIFIDTNALQLTDVAANSIVIETLSTNANWSPDAVINTGNQLKWVVTGDALGTYNSDDPTIDLSSNTGTAIVTVTSSDDLVNLTKCRFSNLNITSIDITQWASCIELWIFGSSSLSQIVGLESVQNSPTFDLRQNGLTTLGSGNFPNVTNLKIEGNKFISLALGSQFPNLTTLSCYSMSTLTTLDLSNMSSLTSILASSLSNLTSITNLSGASGLTSLNLVNSGLTSIDTSGNSSLNSILVQNNSLPTQQVNFLLLNADASGVNNGTLNYNIGNGSPSATENTSNDVLNAYNNLVAKGWNITGSIPS